MVYIPDGIPAIVDEHTFKMAQDRKELNRKGTRSRREKENYLLTGLIECGECGHAFTSNRRFSGRNKTKYLTYRCSNHNKGQKCNCKEVNVEYLEAFVLDTILEQVLADNRRAELVVAFNKQQGQAVEEHRAKKIRLKQEIAQKEQNNANIVKMIEGGRMLTTLMDAIERNEQDIARIKADLEVLLAHPPQQLDEEKFAQLVEDTRRAIAAKDYDELKRFVSLYVSKIIVRNDDISVVVSFSKIVLLVGGADGKPILVTKLTREYVRSFRNKRQPRYF